MSSFHKDFTLNGKSFENTKELIRFSKLFSERIAVFLEEWFSPSDGINIKTSGSTGIPKTIRLKKESMINSALATGKYFNLPEKTSVLLCLPSEYIAGKMMIVRALQLGWYLDVEKPTSNPLENNEKTYDFSAMVPLQLKKSLDNLHQIKKLIVGGGAVNQEIQDMLKQLKTEVFATYGMTETCTHIAIKKLNNTVEKSTFYKVLPTVTIHKDTRNCLVIEAPKISEEVIFTNDVVRLISDTQFEWLGRFDSIINSGGIKLYPEEIEKKLAKTIKNPFFIAGMPDKILGEKLVLIVESTKNNSLLEEVKKCTSLSKFELPKEIFVVSKFIKTPTGKIQRQKTLDLIDGNFRKSDA